MTSIQKTSLRTLIASSGLSEAQKKMWSVFTDAAMENEISSILDAIHSDADALVFLTENMEKKIRAVTKKDASAWQKIVQEEKEYISQIL